MEYDGFYLQSLATNFVFRVPIPASTAGDAGDMVNYPSSRMNGNPFSTTQCNGVGPWWYFPPPATTCGFLRLFGSYGPVSSGFWWNGVSILKSARMMVRMV